MTSEATWSVVSVFGPDRSLLTHLDAIAAQTVRVVVVDDGTPAPDAEVFAALEERDDVDLLRQPRNAGIAAALNRGIQAAFDGGADRVVTFDQDSLPSADFVAGLSDEFDRATARGVIDPAFVVPEFWATIRQVSRTAEDGTLIAIRTIQSGMLLPRSTWERIGAMREEFFIDLVDEELELRALSAGLAPIAAPGVALHHHLGAAYRRPLLSGGFRGSPLPPIITLSTPFRYYYRVRNRRVVNRMYGRRFPARLAAETFMEILHLVEVLRYARPRGPVWAAARRGWRDGRKGSAMGRVPAELEPGLRDVRWALEPVDRG
ncbi:glycosyltransferase [Aeromicrobium sp. YIM 150415]|uniref:glycosyltransferase n=1 Tax=Aeromicrobium sp. YIM 150415 TaxID=2803912 RepID=UPI0019668E37|nr:glycosyltransferase [Aeromicrobium sp. YIM 150415]MBM9465604.1 glycosyltransferase [Aeromicrobium sp. YIM 150415]